MGLVILLVVIAGLEYFSEVFSSTLLRAMAELPLGNISLIILFGIIFLIGDIFMTFPIPLNLPGPVFTAAGCVLARGHHSWPGACHALARHGTPVGGVRNGP